MPLGSLPRSPNVAFVEGDIRDRSSLSSFFDDSENAILFHLVGLIHPRRYVRELFEINVDGTRNVLAEAIRRGVRRIIAISSNSPIGTNPHPQHVFDEDSPYNPYMAYGRSKKAVEDMLNEASDRKEIEVVIIRPCWFYGPEQPKRQSLFFTMIAEGKAPIVGDGENRRSLSYVDNTCQALIRAMDSEKAVGKTYWIADRRPYSMNEIVDTIERLLENEFGIPVAHKRLRLPGIVSEIAYGVDWFLQAVGLYHQKIHVLSEMNKTIACSIRKAEEELGYDPKVELEEGMRRSIRWWIENQK